MSKISRSHILSLVHHWNSFKNVELDFLLCFLCVSHWVKTVVLFSLYHSMKTQALMTFPPFQNQISREIKYTMWSIPWMGLPTCFLFLLEVRGYSQLYDAVHDSKYGWWTIAGTVVTFILFTDCLIYWIHRWMHHRLIYKYVHKPHHMWKLPTPFASHAFHPIDGFLQSAPYHIYVFLFPLHKFTYILLYIMVNIWTVSIHDGDFRVPDVLKPIINGSAHHTDHHLFYNYNYGQYLTLWDRIGGSFKNPSAFEGDGPLELVERLEKEGKLKNGDKKKIWV